MLHLVILKFKSNSLNLPTSVLYTGKHVQIRHFAVKHSKALRQWSRGKDRRGLCGSAFDAIHGRGMSISSFCSFYALTIIVFSSEVNAHPCRSICTSNNIYAPHPGKNPAIIDPQCDLEVAVKRLWWGRVLNAGQVWIILFYPSEDTQPVAW